VPRGACSQVGPKQKLPRKNNQADRCVNRNRRLNGGLRSERRTAEWQPYGRLLCICHLLSRTVPARASRTAWGRAAVLLRRPEPPDTGQALRGCCAGSPGGLADRPPPRPPLMGLATSCARSWLTRRGRCCIAEEVVSALPFVTRVQVDRQNRVGIVPERMRQDGPARGGPAGLSSGAAGRVDP
jgi:hypothetical protein